MRELTYVEAAREGLAEEMARDPSIFVVGEGSVREAAISTRPRACTSCTAPSACAIRPSRSAALPRCAPVRR